MDDLKRLEGKTIESINNDSDGKNSYIIIKFKEGGKLNITSYPNGDEGVGQLDIQLKGVKEKELLGKRILSITEEFDGENDFLIINLKDGGKITVSAFSSSEDSTAGLSTTVYSAEKLVKESLDEGKVSNYFSNLFKRPSHDDDEVLLEILELITDEGKASLDAGTYHYELNDSDLWVGKKAFENKYYVGFDLLDIDGSSWIAKKIFDKIKSLVDAKRKRESEEYEKVYLPKRDNTDILRTRAGLTKPLDENSYSDSQQGEYPMNKLQYESGEEDIKEEPEEYVKPKRKKQRRKLTPDEKLFRQRSFSGGWESTSWRGPNAANH